MGTGNRPLLTTGPRDKLLTGFALCNDWGLAMLKRRHLLTVSLAFAVSLNAQEFRATVLGTITDPQGATIPGVRVEIKNLATNAVVITVTNETGNYVAPFLPTGQYSIMASKEGFKRALRDSLELRVADRLQIDFQMDIGALAEQVTVSAAAELLETSNASKGQVIDGGKV